MKFRGVIRGGKFSELYVSSTAGVDGPRKRLSCSQSEYFMNSSKSFVALPYDSFRKDRLELDRVRMITIAEMINRVSSRVYSVLFVQLALLVSEFLHSRQPASRGNFTCSQTAQTATSSTNPARFTSELSSLLTNTSSPDFGSFKIGRDESLPREQIMGNL